MIHIISQFYNDPNPERNQENESCLLKNLNNSLIYKVHSLIENKTKLPAWALDHEKSVVSSTGQDRLTFQKAFDYADQILEHGDIVLMMNSDIYLDENSPWKEMLFKVFNSNPGKVSLCFSRHEVNARGDIWTDPQAMAGWSQDVWGFQKQHHLPIVPDRMRENALFCVGGAPFCDGRMNYIAKFFGDFQVFNLGLHLKVLHYDRCRGHCLGNMVINENTDQRASDTLKDKHCKDNSNVCPFVTYEWFYEKKLPYSVNEISNCARLEPHIHVSKNEIAEHPMLLQKMIAERLYGIATPDVTKKEKQIFIDYCKKIKK